MPHSQLIQSLERFCIDQKDGFESADHSTIEIIAKYITGLKMTTKKDKKPNKSYINDYFIKQK